MWELYINEELWITSETQSESRLFAIKVLISTKEELKIEIKKK